MATTTTMTRVDILKNGALQLAIDHHRSEAAASGGKTQADPAKVVETAEAFFKFLNAK